MSLAQQYAPDIFDTKKKLSKEEIEKIFAKYTKHFSDYMSGAYRDKEDEEEKEEKRVKDRKDYN